jgi:hypothetical protein
VSTVPIIETPRGQTRISSRAMTRVVSAVAAEALGVEPSQVSVDLVTGTGDIALTVRVPVGTVADEREAGDDGGPSHTDATERRIRSTVNDLTGIRIGDVTVAQNKNRIRLPRLGD